TSLSERPRIGKGRSPSPLPSPLGRGGPCIPSLSQSERCRQSDKRSTFLPLLGERAGVRGKRGMGLSKWTEIEMLQWRPSPLRFLLCSHLIHACQQPSSPSPTRRVEWAKPPPPSIWPPASPRLASACCSSTSIPRPTPPAAWVWTRPKGPAPTRC